MAVPRWRIAAGHPALGRRWVAGLRAGLHSAAMGLRYIGRSSTSADYRAWQRQFLGNRLRLCLWIALLCNLTFAAANLYNLVLYPEVDIVQQTIEILGDPLLYENLKRLLLISDGVTILLLLLCLVVRRTAWGSRHPAVMFLAMSWSMTLIPEILGTWMGLPVPGPWNFVFMAQVVLLPVYWPLHLLSQLGSVVYYFAVNATLGLTKIPGAPGLFNPETILAAVWIGLICDVAVYFYDRLQQREFESRRELRLFLHAVTHDLRTPVIGTSIVLQNLLHKAQAADQQAMITTAKLEQLLAGNDRQLNLIHSILEAHTHESQRIVLRCQPLQLSTLVQSVLADAEALLAQNQIVFTNQITDQLPLIHADADQLWRVFSNLITNALKHNPAGIHLTLDAGLQTPQLLRCTIQDNGVGIPPQQQQRLFELYYRGAQSRYMPGLGLGLYLCRQIITAHGGQIGVISQPGSGSTFWFTLPIAA